MASIEAPPTVGELRIRIKFNASGSAEVDELKRMGAEFINKCNAMRARSKDSEFQRVVALAMTEAEAANMWAVKAATWQHPPSDE